MADRAATDDLVKAFTKTILDKHSKSKPKSKRGRARSVSSNRSKRSRSNSRLSAGIQFNELRDNSATVCIGPSSTASKQLGFRKSLKKGTTHWFTFKTPFVQRCFSYHYRIINDKVVPDSTVPLRYIDAVTIDFQSSSIPAD